MITWALEWLFGFFVVVFVYYSVKFMEEMKRKGSK